MAKQSISRKETQVSMGDSVGKQLEQTVSVDDNSLPSPQELQLYQQIDPPNYSFSDRDVYKRTNSPPLYG